MKALVIFIMLVVTLLACNHTPPNGTDSSRRDSISDPINPMDTTVDRLDPDSVTDTSKLEF